MISESYRILIVEDDENAARYIQTCLGMGRYVSKICKDGHEALKRLSEETFDLILLDIMLPGLDGFEVQERIRDKKIPIIFLTAMCDVTDKVRGLKAGAEDYIVKPFEVMELLVLDEPFNGLDVDGYERMQEIIREEKSRGSLILLACHDRGEMESLADVIYRVEQGRFTRYGKRGEE